MMGTRKRRGKEESQKRGEEIWARGGFIYLTGCEASDQWQWRDRALGDDGGPSSIKMV